MEVSAVIVQNPKVNIGNFRSTRFPESAFVKACRDEAEKARMISRNGRNETRVILKISENVTVSSVVKFVFGG